ncbi:MAG: metal-dependent hydrolase [Burkholderiales bacterium]
MSTSVANLPAIPNHDLWWNGGSALRSRLFDAISLLLPSGEKFVITAVSDWLTTSPPTTPSELQQEVVRFVREEQNHSRAHQLYNNNLSLHAPSRALEHRIEQLVQEMAGWSLPTRLAMASAFEHLTALLSREVLRAGNAWLCTNQTRQTRLWQWHCQEELAHHHVARNVMVAAGVGPLRRGFTLMTAILFLSTDIMAMLWGLLRADHRAGRVRGRQLLVQCAEFSVRVLPSMVRMAWGCCKYVVSIKW